MINRKFWQGKKVFITGHTGFKGSWLSLWLYSLGAEVSGFALAPPTNPSLYNLGRINELVKSTIGDIRDKEALEKALFTAKPEIIIHMAAQPLVRDSYINPVETYATNVMGTVNLLEAVRHCNSVRAVVNVTTDKCYENKEWVWGYRENEAMGGYDPYSNSKACSELVTSSYRNSFFNINEYEKHKVAIASARAGNVIGGGDWAKDRLIPDSIKALISCEPIFIRNPNSIRPWQHVLEPLSGYLLLAQNLYSNGPKFAEGWNFAPNEDDAKPVEWIVKKICSLWDDKATYQIDRGEHPHEAHYLKLDASKAKMVLEWKPRWSLSEALVKIVEWTKNSQESDDIRQITLNQIYEYEASFGEQL